MLERRWFRWTLGLAFWAILAFFFASQTVVSSAYRGHPTTWHQALIFPAIDCGLWAMFTPFVLWSAKRFPFETGNWSKALAFHFVMSIAVAVAELRLFSMIVPFAYGPTAGGRVSSSVVFRNLLPGNLHTAVLTYVLIVAAAHGLVYYERFRDRELRATQLEAKLAQAQLQVLRMQLQPHFLFNTLHSISALVHEDPDGADRMLAQLGDLLRMTLSPEATQEVALQQELDFLDRYLDIEKTRLGERLRLRRTIAPDTLDARVPYLILQPLVENAIRYAVAPRAEGGKVEIRTAHCEGVLRIEIWDDGPGLISPEGATNGTGLGLKNTRERLSQLYGSAASLELSDVPAKGFVAALSIPMRFETADQKPAHTR